MIRPLSAILFALALLFTSPIDAQRPSRPQANPPRQPGRPSLPIQPLAYVTTATLPGGLTYPAYSSIPVYGTCYFGPYADPNIIMELIWQFPSTKTTYTANTVTGKYSSQHPNVGPAGGIHLTVNFKHVSNGKIVGTHSFSITRV